MSKNAGEKSGKLCISSILSPKRDITPTKTDTHWRHLKLTCSAVKQILFSVSLPCRRLPLVATMVLTAVHLYVPVWRSWMFGIVSTGPVLLNVPPPTLVHLYSLGAGLDEVTWHVMDNVSPVFILWSGMVFSVGGSVSLVKKETFIVHASLYQTTYFDLSKILHALCKLCFANLNGVVLQFMIRFPMDIKQFKWYTLTYTEHPHPLWHFPSQWLSVRVSAPLYWWLYIYTSRPGNAVCC